MFPQLSEETLSLASVRAVILVLGFRTMAGTVIRGVGMTAGPLVFVELFGAVRAIKFMAFAGDTSEGEGHDEQGKTFHRGAS